MCFLLHDRAEILPPFSPLVLDDNQDHPHVQMAKVGFAIWNIEYRNLHQAKVVSNGDNSAPLPDLPKVEIQVGKQRGVVGLVEDKRQIKVFVLRERGHPTMKSFQRMVRRASKRIVKGDVP